MKMIKRKGEITIEENSVSFWGFNEGSGSPCKNEEEINKEVENLKARHSENYILKIVDKREKKVVEEKPIEIKDFKMEEEFKIPMEYTKAVARGHFNNFILFGKQGQGKTTLVMKALEEEGIKAVYHSGISTPKALFEFLYENREDKMIVFDDCAGLINNLYAVSILLSAMWSNEEKRIVTWNSTKNNVPNKFVFTSKIIIIANKLPKTDYADVVLSRCLVYNLNLNYRKIMAMMYSFGNKEVVDYIKENSSEATKNFDLRLLKKAEGFYKYNKENWKEMINSMLEVDEELQLIISGLEKTEWCERTGKSQRTYDRYKQQMGLSRAYNSPIRH